jgi:peptidoglycan/xylan/chitin deacetylase (PgdA/CDA1 family)
MLEEISDTTNAIRKITGENVRFFRPPFGSFDREKRKLVEKAGYGFVLWSVNADDFYHLGWGMRTAASIEKKVLRGVRGGDIILAHDDSIQLEKALPVIIETLKARGYRFVTMSELTGEKTR